MSQFHGGPVPPQQPGPFQPAPQPPKIVFVPSTKIADKAARTAGLIGTLKWVLILLNGVGSLIFISIGYNASQPTITYHLDGSFTSEDNPFSTAFGTLFEAAGIGSLVVGTIVILVLFGWFQHMLATNAELVRQGYKS